MGLFNATPEKNQSLKAYDERLETLERGYKALELEWNNTLDKLNRIMGRLNARDKAARKSENGDVEPSQDGPKPFDLYSAQRELAKRKRDGNGLLQRGG